jgi:predicted metalloendopeptidase
MKLHIALLLVAGFSLSAVAQDVDRANFDTNVRVQDDLYRHVNGTWLKNTEIPSDKSNYGSFSALADLSLERIKEILEKTSENSHPIGSEKQKIGDFYKSFLNVELANEKGYQPLMAELNSVRAIKTKSEVIERFGHFRKIGVSTPVATFVTVDAKNSSQYQVGAIQSGTSLPDRDYYLKDDEKSAAVQAALKAYVLRLFELVQTEDAETIANNIVELEKKLAEVQWARIELRDAEKRYNKYSVSDLNKLGTNFDWNQYLPQVGLGQIQEINIMTPSFFEGFDKIFGETSEEVWRQYLEYRLLDAYAPALSEDFVNAHFELYSKQLAGVPEQKPRWKQAVEATAGAGAGDFGVLGEAVAKVYVAEHFKPEAKQQMEALVGNLLTAFGSSVDELDWMSDTTKGMAKEKLSKITTKIGYPQEWLDYSSLQIRADDLVGNMMRSAAVEFDRNTNKLGRPVDKKEWGMTPQTVNAYYNPTKNEIVFPAAILQPPFFDAEAPMALNYGGIGAVIGHEISHAFDDQGSRYDGDGNLKNWWTDSDRESFKALADRLIAQYGVYEPLPGKQVNGQLTLGENIADLSGLSISFKALQIAKNGTEPEKVAGWSADQMFFVGWSRVWARKYRESEMIKRLLTDSHSPSEFRANGPVMNIDAFYQAFEVKEGDKLYKPQEERIRIW